MKPVNRLFRGVLSLLLLGTVNLGLAQQPGIHQPRGSSLDLSKPPAAPSVRLRSTRAVASEPGKVCTTIDFEGVGNLAPVPTISGISSPQWLAIIDEDAGGTGNIAQEPSPQTVAFWLGGAVGQRDIVFGTPASKVQFYYASAVTVTMQALDANGVVVSSVSGGPNYDSGTGDPTGAYNSWAPLTVEADGNKIRSVRVFGSSNYTAIDDLKVCTNKSVEAIEVTQAIQQYQKLDDLKASLQADREPPVPIIARKPAVVRVYMQKVDNVADVRVQLSGAINETRSSTLQPHCFPEDQRRLRNGCQSIDFYFPPPEGNWDLTVKVLDTSGNELETHSLPMKSRTTKPLVFKAVSVCHGPVGPGDCESPSRLTGLTGFLKKIAPTSSVSVAVSNSIVWQNTADFPTFPDKGLEKDGPWWEAVAKDVAGLYGFFDAVGDFRSGAHTLYYGMVRPTLAGGTDGMAAGIPSRGAASRSEVDVLGAPFASEVVAHETGHTLNLRHTNTDVPRAKGSLPGCLAFAEDEGTDWPFAANKTPPGDNTIRSTARREVGFDVVARKVVIPESTFEVMSYCLPMWVSPFSYKKMITQLSGGDVNSANRQAKTAAAGASPSQTVLRTPLGSEAPQFWVVSGTIDSASIVRFDPLFDDAAAALPGTGSGSHRVETRDAADAVLAFRFFTPSVPSAFGGGGVSGPSRFFEMLPVSSSAARIVVVGPTGTVIGTLRLGGMKPVVSNIQPSGGLISGVTDIIWGVNDPDSASRTTTAKVYYSNDDGGTWAQIGRVQGVQMLRADFDTLPGSKGKGRLMVSVSDGVNSASAVSDLLTVTRRPPKEIKIISPQPNEVLPAGTQLSFDGMVYDVDDGLLDGKSISWTSSQDGPIGDGSYLTFKGLTKGTHTITMTGTDSDGNVATASVAVRVAGDVPTLSLNVDGLDTLPTTCVQATIDAKADPGGVGLSKVEYSLDGGATYLPVALNRLPFKFIVPGSGYFHLVARTYDESGQSAAKDARFFVNSPCVQGGTPRLAGKVFSQGAVSPGVRYVDFTFTNSGQGEAKAVRISNVVAATVAGSGTVTLNKSLSLPLPISLPDLPIGQSETIRLYFNVPSTVTRFTVTESGSLTDKFDRPMTFSTAQSVMAK